MTMTLAQFALSASVPLLVLTLGLRATAADATSLLRRPAKLIPALLAIFVVVPLAAAGLVAWLDPALPDRGVHESAHFGA